MESILVNSSSQPDPVSVPTREYEEMTRDRDPTVKEENQPRETNERRPLYPPHKETRKSEHGATEVIYAEPLLAGHESQSGEASYDSTSESAAEYSVPAPEQFKEYTVDQLEQLATALDNTLKRRQNDKRYVDEARHMHRRGAVAEVGMKLDTIFEHSHYEPIPEIEDCTPSTPEVPPPLPIKKRRNKVEVVIMPPPIDAATAPEMSERVINSLG